MIRQLSTKIARWFIGPFQNRRMAMFWLVSALSLGGTSAWFEFRAAERAAEEDNPFALLGPAPACEVVSVHDGDTMKLDCGWSEDKPMIVDVRLHCIDAPELDQEPWGKLARDHLRKLAGNAVAIEVVERDRYHRLVARVIANGEQLNLKMVADGFAAMYPQYCRDRSYYETESSVRTRRVGIWSTPGVQQKPWEWRRDT